MYTFCGLARTTAASHGIATTVPFLIGFAANRPFPLSAVEEMSASTHLWFSTLYKVLLSSCCGLGAQEDPQEEATTPRPLFSTCF